MMFISMVFASFALVILAIHLVLFVIGLVLTFKWRGNKKKQIKTKTVTKVFAVILTVLGVIGFVVPMIAILGFDASHKFEKITDMNSFDKKVYVDRESIDDGFEIDGVYYVHIDELRAPDNENLEKKCALVYGEYQYTGCYIVDNELDEDMLAISYHVYVPEDKADEIRDYYLNQTKLTVVADYTPTGTEEKKYYTLEEFDRNTLIRIRDLEHGPYDLEFTTNDLDESIGTRSIWVEGSSSDNLYKVYFSLYYVNNNFVLYRVEGGDKLSGITIPPEDQEYIKQILRDNTELTIK